MDCKRPFRSRDCFAKHKAMKSKQQKSICHLVYNCGKCGFRTVGTKKNHVCPGQRKCRNCKEIVGPNHQCYIQSYECKSEMTENEGEEEVFNLRNLVSSSLISSQIKKMVHIRGISVLLIKLVMIAWICP